MIGRAGLRVFVIRTLPIAAVLLAVSASLQTSATAVAQLPGEPSSVTAAPLLFEVATVKRNTSGSGGSHTDFHGGTFIAINVQLKNLMQYQAFGIPEVRILGGPKWLDSERFDIEAKADSAVIDQFQAMSLSQRTQQMQAMFQQLLADRFKLTTHWETRELPVYALLVAKSGSRLQRAQNLSETGTSAGNGQLSATSATLADVAQVLTQQAAGELGRVVVDRTNLDGKYDIHLQWTPDLGPGSGPDGNGLSQQSGSSIFTAIQEQLGLKLESARSPVQVLIIDRVEMPSEN